MRDTREWAGFIAREIMREFAPRLMLVNFWDMDVAHGGSYSLYLQAITRTMEQLFCIGPPDFPLLAAKSPVKLTDVFACAKEWLNL